MESAEMLDAELINENVLILDDHVIFGESIQRLLKSTVDGRVDLASNLSEAENLLDTESYGIMISDINLGDENAFACWKTAGDKDTRIIALSMYEDRRVILRALDKGAMSYLTKDTDSSELLKAIHTILNGLKYFPENIRKVVFYNQNNENEFDPMFIKLTSQEVKVLECIADELTQEQIGDKLCISASTVVYYKRRLMKKFNSNNTAGLIRMAMRYGYIE